MSSRLWFPQLDVYDTIRRMSVLLDRWAGQPLGPERLYIVDFYFANPPLLHQTNMPQAVRRQFNQLSIQKPEKSFISYPTAPLLFHRMESVQKEALRTLTGKGLVDRQSLETGILSPSERGKEVFSAKLGNLATEEEGPIIEFLVHDFGRIDEDSIAGLRRRTGLRRAGQ